LFVRQRMNHRIATGALVVHQNRVLLVRHRKPNAYDFWVAPGGGAEGGEDLHVALRREVREESGLVVEPERIAYIEELLTPHTRECKVWFYARLVGGVLSTSALEAKREFIVDAKFMSRAEFDGKTVFPPVLANVFWTDLDAGFPEAKYLGVREMEFY
jgi:8-oxo-dGTP diphosphatase